MLRRMVPERTCTINYANYSRYKKYLRSDFNQRCGYCDISDHILGGETVFQIDHFAPKKFADLVNEYSNLVYSCPSCNRAKWDDWPMPSVEPSHDGLRGYVDPCDEEYDTHLSRISSGKIIAETELGEYMRNGLKLFLIKHKYLWMQDILYEQINKIRIFLASSEESDDNVSQLKKTYHELTEKYFMYYQINFKDI